MDPDILKEFPDLPNDLSYEIRRLLISLNFWDTIPCPKNYGKEEILKGILLKGPQYISRLKDEWEYGIRRDHCFPVNGRDYRNWKAVECYSALPTIEHLIHWEVIPNDYEYMFKKDRDLDSNYLEEFRQIAEETIPSEIDFPSDLEVLTEVKTSSSFDIASKKKIPFYKARTGPFGEDFALRFKGMRTIVPIAAGNVRDALVATIDTYNSVKWIDLLISRIIDNIDESVYNSNPRKYHKKLRRAVKKHGKYIYYLRDIKKCGLTFPRELFHIIEEVLVEKFPDEERLKRFSIYRSYDLYMEDGTQFPNSPDRGFGLGMANNLVTLCQCLVYQMIRARLPEAVNISGSFGNDDSVLSLEVKDWTTIEETASLIEMEDTFICKGLGIEIHEDKSFWSFYPIFFEEYGKEAFQKKGSRLAMSLSHAMLSPHISYAKAIVNSLSPLFTGDKWESNILNDIIYYWGYEFFPRETNFSYKLGGWLSFRKLDTSPVLQEIFSLTEDEYAPAMSSIKQKEQMNRQFVLAKASPAGCKNIASLGKKYGVRYLAEDVELPKSVSGSMLIFSPDDFDKYFSSLFEMSRRPYKMLLEMTRRGRAPKMRPDSVSKYDILSYVISTNTDNLSIPKEMVLSSTALFLMVEEDIDIDAKFYYNSTSRYLEYLRRSKKIVADKPFSEFEQESLVEFYDKSYWDPALDDDPVRILTLNGDFIDCVNGFGPNPFIILYQYYKEHDLVPTMIQTSYGLGRKIEPRLWNYKPRNEREAALVMNLIPLMDDYEIQDLLDVIEENKIDECKNSAKEERRSCYEHIVFANAGWSDDMMTFDVIDEDCFVCNKYRAIWSLTIKSAHDEDVEKRALYRDLLRQAKQNLREYLSKDFELEEFEAYIQDAGELSDQSLGGGFFFEDEDEYG
jgi:hypothetical protein